MVSEEDYGRPEVERISGGRMNPQYPIFIPSKGRWRDPQTVKALKRIGVPFTVVIEKQEQDCYAKSIGADNLLVLPHRDKGLTVTRNWIWDYAESLGVEKFWTMDDNIQYFCRLNKNMKHEFSNGTFLKVIEDFVGRYANVPVAGMQYEFFMPRRKKCLSPFSPNKRVYSNMLIETKACDPRGKPYRNECYFNDDTDLCLRILKDGLCTILFNAFLIKKTATMTCKGGNTPEYQDDGRWKMAEELRQKHPDVTTITHKWGRWQHHVDYRRFKGNQLIKKPDAIHGVGVDNYGMKLVKKHGGT
jgi:hypothetical protein